jgi:hypothetical protein
MASGILVDHGESCMENSAKPLTPYEKGRLLLLKKKEAELREQIYRNNLKEFGVKGRLIVRFARQICLLLGIPKDVVDAKFKELLSLTHEELMEQHRKRLKQEGAE